MRLQSDSSGTLLATTHTDQMRHGSRSQFSPPSDRHCLHGDHILRASERSSLRLRGRRSSPISGEHPEKQRPTIPICNPQGPRRRTRSHSDPTQPASTQPGETRRGPQGARLCPREGRARPQQHPAPRSPPNAYLQHSLGTGLSGSCAALPYPPLPTAPHPGTRAPAARAARSSASSRHRCSLPASVRFQGARHSPHSAPGGAQPIPPAGNTPPRRQGSAPKTAHASSPPNSSLAGPVCTDQGLAWEGLSDLVGRV